MKPTGTNLLWRKYHSHVARGDAGDALHPLGDWSASPEKIASPMHPLYLLVNWVAEFRMNFHYKSRCVLCVLFLIPTHSKLGHQTSSQMSIIHQVGRLYYSTAFISLMKLFFSGQIMILYQTSPISYLFSVSVQIRSD